LKNQFVESRAAKDIDIQVDKILKGLGNPEPPLNLDLVRELLKLDRAYYTGTDHGAISEFASNIKKAGKQLLLRPSLIFDVITKFDIRALYLPDQKRILLDSSQPPIKQRWNEGHEIIHSILPWHEDTAFGDDKSTLTHACYEELEWEANYGAGQLLFLKDRYKEEIADLSLELKTIKQFAGSYGNSHTTGLWRVIEESKVTCFGAIHAHPWRPPEDFNELEPIRYLIQSRNYEKFFTHVTEIEIFEIIKSYCRNAKGGPLGETSTVLRDIYGNRYEFSFETFYNTFDALTLGVCRRKHNIIVPVSSNVLV